MFLDQTSLVKETDSRYSWSICARSLAKLWVSSCNGRGSLLGLLCEYHSFFGITRRGSYSLHTRFLIEMASYLQKNYGSRLSSCYLCHHIATKVRKSKKKSRKDFWTNWIPKYKICPNRACSVKIHKHCAARYFSSRHEPKCPASCGSSWTGNTEYSQILDNTMNLDEGGPHMIRRSARGIWIAAQKTNVLWDYTRLYLNKLYFLTHSYISSFLYGIKAIHVIIDSGCSIQEQYLIRDRSSVLWSCRSSWTSSTWARF